MNRQRIAVLAALVPVLCGVRVPVRGDTVVVTAGFNDASGIGSDSTPNSPYTLGSSVSGRGQGELGWTGTWSVSNGGGPEVPQLATATAAAAFEGDGGMSVVGASEGTFIHRSFVPQFGRFTIQQYVNLRSPNDSFGSRPADDRVGNPSGIGPGWNTTSGTFRVGDGGNTLNTGITVTPGLWYKVAEEVDVTSGTWEFFVNGKPYNSDHPLRFRGNPTFISNIDYLTGAPAYVDELEVIQQNPGDLNHDGTVNFADLLILAQHYGSTRGTFETGDLSGDGTIDFTDLLLFTQNYGKSTPAPASAAAVPEPAVMVIPVILACLSRRRRRGRRRAFWPVPQRECNGKGTGMRCFQTGVAWR